MGARTVEELWLKKSVFCLHGMKYTLKFAGPRCLMVMTSDFYRYSQDLEVAGSSPAGVLFRPGRHAGRCRLRPSVRTVRRPIAEAVADASFGLIHAGSAAAFRHYGSLSRLRTPGL